MTMKWCRWRTQTLCSPDTTNKTKTYKDALALNTGLDEGGGKGHPAVVDASKLPRHLTFSWFFRRHAVLEQAESCCAVLT